MTLTTQTTTDRRTFTQLAGALIAGAAGEVVFGMLPQASATEATLAALDSAQAEYEAAMAELASIAAELENAQYSLYECQANLQTTNDQIAALEESIVQNQLALQEAQEILATRIDSSYRAGTTGLLEVLLQSTSFDDFVSRLYYTSKVTDSDAEAIETVRQIKEQLETEEAQLIEQRAYQEQLVVEQQEYTNQLAATESYYESYTAGLSSEVMALMEQAQAETLAAQEAERQAWLAAQETVVEYVEQEVEVVDPDTGETTTVVETVPVEVVVEPSYEESSDDDYGSDSNDDNYEPSYGGGTGNHIYSAASLAWNYCGVPYVWGGSDPSGFDCSGLTSYVYGCLGYSIGRTTYDQIASIESCGNMVYSMDQLEAGDLIFPHSGHVGIYEGGGCLIDAPYPGEVVQYRSCWFSSCYGGCPV